MSGAASATPACVCGHGRELHRADALWGDAVCTWTTCDCYDYRPRLPRPSTVGGYDANGSPVED